MALSQRDTEHVFQELRGGTTPARGLEAFAVGIDRQRNELQRMLDHVGHGEGSFKFLRGGYGCGKTFVARLAALDAQERGFATSFVVVSVNDLRFHNFADVYRHVVSELATKACPRGALGDILDRWIGKIEEELVRLGADDTADDFDDRVRAKLDEQLAALTGGKAPEELTVVVRAIFDLKQEGKLADAATLISWLAGSKNIAADVKRRAGIKGDIGNREALGYLRGILEITKSAGYKGLVIVIDELETVIRSSRRDTRAASLEGLRKIIDAAGSYPGLLWVFTGTPEFFDSNRGVQGLQPLHDRIAFQKIGNAVSLRQPQLQLTPFDRGRLVEVALRLREQYPSSDRARFDAQVTPEHLGALADSVTQGFAGDVGVVPRQFLRQLVNIFDLVDQDDTFDISSALGFEPRDLTPEEQARRQGKPAVQELEPEADDPKAYTPPVLDW
jgi:hypothetical protein